MKLKPELTTTLLTNHQEFQSYLAGLNAEQLVISKNNKWSAVQQLEHICLSVQPVRLAFTLPKFLLRALFGKANRASRTYTELISKYKAKLQAGGRTSGRFIPATSNVKNYQRLNVRLTKEVKGLAAKINRFSEAELDLYILPHPLLGKLTLREMICFTCYHVQHHQELTKQNLS
ncbi:MAG TPA: DinB family protein [Cyclobacteriaceae bacterium]|nr:MAG: DinB superfamily protein [Bacteroidetes bacterium OLB12]HNR73411.1 DinB family protein [Cyclobacteriaceae bacterium]HNT51743.1 DinB family protein [Cyclobacteriaceae bacterium]